MLIDSKLDLEQELNEFKSNEETLGHAKSNLI